MSDETEDTRNYEIGYGKPPVHSRFKPGVSGNPSGKSTKKLERAASKVQQSNDVLSAMERRIRIKRNGKMVQVPFFVAFFETLQLLALKGNISACKQVIEQYERALVTRAKLLGRAYTDYWDFERVVAERNADDPLTLEYQNKFRRRTRLK